MNYQTKSQKKNLKKNQKNKENIDKYICDTRKEGYITIWTKKNEIKYVSPENIYKIPLTRKEIEEIFPHDNEDNDINYPYFFEKLKKRLDGRPKVEVMEILIQKDRFNTTILENICMYIFKEEHVDYFMEFLKIAPIGFFKNYETVRGENPLHTCAACRNMNALKKLLILGFDKNQKNKNGQNVQNILEIQKETYQKKLDFSEKMIEELNSK